MPAGAGITATHRHQLAGVGAPERDGALEQLLASRSVLGQVGAEAVGGSAPRPGGALAVAADPQVLEVLLEPPTGGGGGGDSCEEN